MLKKTLIRVVSLLFIAISASGNLYGRVLICNDTGDRDDDGNPKLDCTVEGSSGQDCTDNKHRCYNSRYPCTCIDIQIISGAGEHSNNFGVPTRKGLSWGKVRHNQSLGTDLISCHAGDGCDPHDGNSSCDEKLPILCIKNDGSPNPGIEDGQWRTWAKGHITTTSPVKGSDLKSFEAASLLCERQFGEGWRMAQHHEGDHKRGWMFEAYGNVRDDTRFWIYISDTNGNCWEQVIQHPAEKPVEMGGASNTP